jgi:hypothetical protein
MSIAKRGTKYASDGEIISVDRILKKKILEPAESIPFSYSLIQVVIPQGYIAFMWITKNLTVALFRL